MDLQSKKWMSELCWVVFPPPPLNNHTQLLRCMTDRYECLMRKPQLVELSVPYLATKTSAAQQALLKQRSPETQVRSQQPPTAVSWEMIRARYFIPLLCFQKSLFHNIHWNAHLINSFGPTDPVRTCRSEPVRPLNSELKQEKGGECRTTRGSIWKRTWRQAAGAAAGRGHVADGRPSWSRCSRRCSSSGRWRLAPCSPDCWPGCRTTCRSTTSSPRLTNTMGRTLRSNKYQPVKCLCLENFSTQNASHSPSHHTLSLRFTMLLILK